VAAPTEPEREVLRRVLPFAPAAAGVAFTLGYLVGGPGVAWSATLAVVLVAINVVGTALSLAWAARVSPIAVYAVGLGGFALRLLVFLMALLALNQLAWFSALSFTAAFVPATITLLVYEATIVSSRKVQADLWYFRERT
jgi:hypothetical protein